jgi:dTDP-4-amino-4,6-dideoxygalactose transaminase
MASHNPYSIVDDFENRIAEWCGSRYAVAAESGTAAIFLSLMYYKKSWGLPLQICIPRHTYVSVPCSIIHAGAEVYFDDRNWHGEYELYPLNIWDAALRFKKNMYTGGFQCLSFHIKKHLPIGRGGMILTNSENAYNWLKLARFDGREPIPLQDQKEFKVLGWNMYMQPSDAARGIQLFEVLRQKYPDGVEDLKVEDQGYTDLSKYEIFKT